MTFSPRLVPGMTYLSLASLADPLSELVTWETSLMGSSVESVRQAIWCHTGLTSSGMGRRPTGPSLSDGSKPQTVSIPETPPGTLWREAEMRERASGPRRWRTYLRLCQGSYDICKVRRRSKGYGHLPHECPVLQIRRRQLTVSSPRNEVTTVWEEDYDSETPSLSAKALFD